MKSAQTLNSVGKFHLIASLGQGGMAKVYLAFMAGPGGFAKLVVIKVLRDEVLGENNADAVAMFWDEARLSARMVHPNIVHTFEVGEIDGRHYLAMEYLDGQTYRAVQMRMEAAGGLPLREDLRILSETARGLHYAHTLRGFNGEPLRVVHRDVSPQNVFVTYDGQVKLLDFGIAKSHVARNMTEVGVIKGKIDYIAPEQLRGEPVDGRADVFALGAMLWEAITKQRFAGERGVADVTKLHKRLEGSELKVRAVKPDVPDALAAIVDRAIAVSPDARFASAADFADAIDAYLEAHEKPVGAKSLASVVAPLFVAEREAMQKLIDQQASLSQSDMVKLNEETGNLPMLGPVDGRSASRRIPPRGESLEDGTRTRRDLVEEAPAPLREAVPSAPAKRSRRPVVITLALAAAIGAAAALIAPSERPAVVDEPPASASSHVQTHAPSVPRAPEPQEVVADSVIIDLKVSPADAVVTLDGDKLSLPFSGEFRRGKSVHHLEASAEGYRFLRRSIEYDRDQVIHLELEPLPTSAPATPPPSPAQRRRGAPARAEAPPRVEAAPAVHAEQPSREAAAPGSDLSSEPRTRKGPREIDVSNPYKSAPP